MKLDRPGFLLGAEFVAFQWRPATIAHPGATIPYYWFRTIAATRSVTAKTDQPSGGRLASRAVKPDPDGAHPGHRQVESRPIRTPEPVGHECRTSDDNRSMCCFRKPQRFSPQGHPIGIIRAHACSTDTGTSRRGSSE